MATACIAQVTFQFEPKDKPVVVAFDTPDASSDGGLILLKGIDTHLGLTKRLAACVDDERQAAKVRHGMLELVRQRVFGLAAGYADCNDAARLADDVIHKLVVGRDPIAGPALASQPTLSRFENAVGRRTLIAMGHVLADTVIEHHRRRLKAVVVPDNVLFEGGAGETVRRKLLHECEPRQTEALSSRTSRSRPLET